MLAGSAVSAQEPPLFRPRRLNLLFLSYLARLPLLLLLQIFDNQGSTTHHGGPPSLGTMFPGSLLWNLVQLCENLKEKAWPHATWLP